MQTEWITAEENQTSMRRLHHVIQIQNCLARADFNVDGFMKLVVDQIQTLMTATGVVIELVEGDEMVYRAATGTVEKYLGLRLARSTSISGLCVKEKKILCSADTEDDPRVNLEACRLVKARSMIVVPLFHEGDAVGVLKVLSSSPHSFQENDSQFLQLMAGLIGSGLAHQMFHNRTQALLNERTEALEKLQEAEVKLRHLASYDELTGLPNRRLFLDKFEFLLARMKREKNQTESALLFLDVDHFKAINDQHGHDVGDELLKAFSSRLKQNVREVDVAARFGGDEFVLLLVDVQHQNDAILIADKIVKKMKEPFNFINVTLSISISVGVTFLDPHLKSDELLKQADIALYLAKKAGRDNFKIFEPKNEQT